jgi:hypothetical protein
VFSSVVFFVVDFLGVFSSAVFSVVDFFWVFSSVVFFVVKGLFSLVVFFVVEGVFSSVFFFVVEGVFSSVVFFQVDFLQVFSPLVIINLSALDCVEAFFLGGRSSCIGACGSASEYLLD